MIIKNANVNGKTQNIIIKNGIIVDITDKEISENCIDAGGKKVIPGLVDIHTHGIMGYDTMNCDFEQLCSCYAKFGTTSFLPTTMTMDYAAIEKVQKSPTNYPGAHILGFHFEGPYISENKKGAQDESCIRIPRIGEFDNFAGVKMITVAPEVENGQKFIKEISKSMIVSLGHTDCDYETAVTAIDNGANCLTHLFNAMPPLHHRSPGPIGAAAEKGIYAQIICDGLHVHKSAFLAAYKIFGADRLCLISDSIPPAKLSDGEYMSGGLPVIVKNNEIRLKSNGSLAGSSYCLMDCVKKAIDFGISENDAVKMATETPANLLGINKGRIQRGYDADLLIVENDYSIIKTVIAGKEYN